MRFSAWIIYRTCTGGQTVVYLRCTCSKMPNVDLALYGVYGLKIWVSGECATIS